MKELTLNEAENVNGGILLVYFAAKAYAEFSKEISQNAGASGDHPGAIGGMISQAAGGNGIGGSAM